MISYITGNMKIIVLDFDETLGYFVQLSIFWESLKFYLDFINKQDNILNQKYFNNLLDLFTNFLRPDIVKILTFIKKKKIEHMCNRVMIYTNNSGAYNWVNMFISYFEDKLNYKLFDRVIAAFKVKGEVIEICRTSNDKKINDLIRCTKLPENTKICYIDDVYYPKMVNENVYYINVKPYYYDYKFDFMFDELSKSNKLNHICDINFKSNMLKIIKKFKYTPRLKKSIDLEIDIIISKEMLTHLNKFFHESQNKTRKLRSSYNSKTKKNNNIINSINN